MLLYAFLFPIIAIISIIWFALRYKNGKNSLGTTIMWTFFWIFVILFSVFPEFSNTFAAIFGITRGLDFIIILVFIILFYTIFKLYLIVDKMQNDINTMVKEVALNNEVTIEDKEE